MLTLCRRGWCVLGEELGSSLAPGGAGALRHAAVRSRSFLGRERGEKKKDYGIAVDSSL